MCHCNKKLPIRNVEKYFPQCRESPIYTALELIRVLQQVGKDIKTAIIILCMLRKLSVYVEDIQKNQKSIVYRCNLVINNENISENSPNI